MGADGHIAIWSDEVVRKIFPDCDALFPLLPSHYVDQLDGATYHHCYWGDNLPSVYTEEMDWFGDDGYDKGEPKWKPGTVNRLREFVAWLEKNETHWEVWT